MLAVWQAIQALQAATQLWREKPDKSAQEAMQGLSHFPGVMQALVKVGHTYLCSNVQPLISKSVTCVCTVITFCKLTWLFSTKCQQLHLLEPLMLQSRLSCGTLMSRMLLFAYQVPAVLHAHLRQKILLHLQLGHDLACETLLLRQGCDYFNNNNNINALQLMMS